MSHAALIWQFAVLEFVLCWIPGPAVLLTIATSMRRGPQAGFAAIAGILAGNTLYFVLSGIGIVAVLRASFLAFTVLKYAGAAYLAYLGVRALFARPSGTGAADRAPAPDRRRAFASGFVTQVANPKAIVFFVAILPQFVDPHANAPVQIAVLTLVSIAIETGVLSCYLAASSRVRRTPLAERASLWIERIGGGVLLAIAARMAREPLATP